MESLQSLNQYLCASSVQTGGRSRREERLKGWSSMSGEPPGLGLGG